jgi:tetratricopeptide (TPR) repeat protein
MIPKDPNPKVIEANFYIDKDDLPGAIKIIEDAIKSGEEYAYLYLALGDLYSALNSTLYAKKHYEQSIDIAIKDDDKQVIIAAKAGLANMYINDASDDFSSLPKVQQYDALQKLIPFVGRKKILRNLLFASNPSNCITTQGYPGRWVPDDDSPTGYSCRRIIV